MKNAKLGKIELRSSKLPITRHNLSRDVHTTMSFCDFQPTMVHEMESDSSFTMNIETGILMGSMVCPTMGRLNEESFGIFVPTEDIFPCYKEFKTGTPFSYGGNTFVPLHRPRVSKAFLSIFCLFGSRVTLYDCMNPSTPLESDQRWRCYDTAGTSDLISKIKQSYGNTVFLNTYAFSDLGSETMHAISTLFLLRSTGLSMDESSWVPTAVPIAGNPLSTNDGYLYGKDNDTADSLSVSGTRFVSIEKPDFQINIPYKSSSSASTFDSLACLCFKMSDFGRRIYKVLRGSGIKPSFNDSSLVDISPIFAVWKAYYDMFGIKKWDNYQSTSLSKLISYWLSLGCPSYLTYDNTSRSYFSDFMMDVGRMWFTDEQDYITAHQPNIEDDPTNPISSSGFIDVGSSLGSIGDSNDVVKIMGYKPTPLGNSNYHAAISRVLHSQVDSELLKKFYLWTNRNSIIGQNVAELLKAQGHGKWIEDHQSHFIGHHSVPLRIDKVVSQSDTYNSATQQGALLGEYGGRGLGYDDNSIMSYRTREHGFFIVLSAIVPKAGFCQGEDLRWRRDTRMQEYQPEFDGVGMEASPKSLVYTGSIRQPLNSDTDKSRFKFHDKTFGFVPTYSRYKYLQNLINGEFEFASSQLDKLSYTLDRLIFPNDSRCELVESDETYFEYRMKFGSLDSETMPIAGVLWRYLGRYGWLANFRRIFAVRGTSDNAQANGWFIQGPFQLELTVSGPDDFIVHLVQNNMYYAHMLSLEGSYETKSEGNAGGHDMVVSKA